MELTAAQIEFISRDIQQQSITLPGLADSLLDHICCAIENGPDTDFYQAYTRALDAFGKEGLEKVQQETILLSTIQKQETMKKTMFALGYIAAFLSTTGLLFKFQQWPGAAIMLTLGIILLNFGFLPMYFYNRYKRVAG